MPGPVRYSKSGKVKKSAPRKYESGRGWSKLTPTEQAAPSVGPTRAVARKREVRRAVSRQAGQAKDSTVKAPERRSSEPIRPSLLPRKEIVTAVLDALSQPVDLPGTRFDKLGEMLSFLTPGGVVKGATVKGVSGLRAAVPQREAAKRALARRASRAEKLAGRPSRRAAARDKRRTQTSKRAQRRNERNYDREGIEDGERPDPPWVFFDRPLKSQVEEMKYWRRSKNRK